MKALLLLGIILPLAASLAQESGRLTVAVILVGNDLDLKPVPKQAFILRSQAGEERQITTSFAGDFEIDLPAGTYLLKSAAPVALGSTAYSWTLDIEVRPSATSRIELSNDNATTEEIAAPVTNETELFQAFGGSVFKVIAEGGHGSGFLADSRGLIVTNHHVIQGSSFVAVKVNEQHKYLGEVLAEDSNNDVAVVRIHPEAVAGLRVMTLMDEALPPTIGDRVVAIGSPLSTETIMTSGIVSKVESGALYSDVRISPGNSGGPLLDMKGNVLGINTFLEGGPVGPGVSGIVRAHIVRPTLDAAFSRLDTEPPPLQRLPEPSGATIPAETLREQAIATKVVPSQYQLDVGKFDVTLITPVVITSLSIEGEREAATVGRRRNRAASEEEIGSDLYEWRRYVGDYRPVVTIQATPELGMPPGSWAAAVLAGMGGTAATGLRLWFKADFGRMELVRDGEVVAPYHPGRHRQVVDQSVAGNRLTDIAYFGAYEFSPEVFKPGASLELRIWEHGADKPTVKAIPVDVANRVWSHFERYSTSIVP